MTPSAGQGMLLFRTAFFLSFLSAILSSGSSFANEPPLLTGGRIEVIDRARLASDQPGILATEIPQEGTRVQAAEVIARLDDEIPKAALAAAEVLASSDADVRAKKNGAELAAVELERAQFANRRSAGTVPELEVQRLELTYKQALLETERAEKELELNQRRRDQAFALFQSYQVRAPFSGSVTRVMRQRGEAVRQGEPIVEIVSIDRVRIALEVPLKLRDQLKEGREVTVIPVEITDEAAPSGKESEGQNNVEVSEGSAKQDAAKHSDANAIGLRGRITFVDPSAEPLSQTVRVHVIVDQNIDHRLIPGLTANVKLDSPQQDPSVAKP